VEYSTNFISSALKWTSVPIVVELVLEENIWHIGWTIQKYVVKLFTLMKDHTLIHFCLVVAKPEYRIVTPGTYALCCYCIFFWLELLDLLFLWWYITLSVNFAFNSYNVWTYRLCFLWYNTTLFVSFGSLPCMITVLISKWVADSIQKENLYTHRNSKLPLFRSKEIPI
jgi:hypothetical protein